MAQRPCIIDTNVPVVANGKSPQAADDLVEKCIDVLMEITREGGLVVDGDGRIVGEYEQNLNFSGQPGTGDMFFRWVHDHQWQPEFCERRRLTCLDETEQIFEEFPHSVELNDFDRSDRKFVAVANSGEEKRPILQAVDFKWWGWKEALASVNIIVIFIDEIAAEAGYREHVSNA
jgi:hypothetical protein